jgi:hypothetical protein
VLAERAVRQALVADGLSGREKQKAPVASWSLSGDLRPKRGQVPLCTSIAPLAFSSLSDSK